jgi:hypothetical protein
MPCTYQKSQTAPLSHQATKADLDLEVLQLAWQRLGVHSRGGHGFKHLRKFKYMEKMAAAKHEVTQKQ